MGINFKPRFKLKVAGGDSALNKRGVNQTNLHDVYLSVLPGHTFSCYILIHHSLMQSHSLVHMTLMHILVWGSLRLAPIKWVWHLFLLPVFNLEEVQ